MTTRLVIDTAIWSQGRLPWSGPHHFPAGGLLRRGAKSDVGGGGSGLDFLIELFDSYIDFGFWGNLG